MSQTCYALDCCGEEHHIQCVAGRIHLCNHESKDEDDILRDKAFEALGPEIAPCFLFKKMMEQFPHILISDPYLIKFHTEYKDWVARGQIQDIGNFRRIC